MSHVKAICIDCIKDTIRIAKCKVFIAVQTGLLQSRLPHKHLPSSCRRRESSLYLIRELPPSLSQIGTALASHQADDDIVENGKQMGSVAHAQLRVIFPHGHIPSIVQTILVARQEGSLPPARLQNRT
jgi:hypothetical protein